MKVLKLIMLLESDVNVATTDSDLVEASCS
jgi:hypothetical protein